MPTTPFSPEHDALRDSVRRFVDDRLAPHARDWDVAGLVPASVVAEAAELGFIGVELDEAVGGGGGDVLAGLVVAEEIGRSGSGSVVVTLLDAAHGATTLLAAAGSKSPWLSAAVAGRARVAVAVHDVPKTPARAARDGGGWRLHGTKTRVVDGTRADAAVVMASAPDGPALFLAEISDGWSAEPGPERLGWRATALAEVDLDGLAAERLPGDVVEVVGEQVDRHGLAHAAAAVAGARRTWEEGRAYALEREAFGRPIGRFQVNRHALAAAAGLLEAAERLVHEAAVRLADGDRTLVPHARLVAARTAGRVADLCLQLHGGYGYSMEFDVQRAWRDDRMLRLDAEAEDALRDRITERMGHERLK